MVGKDVAAIIVFIMISLPNNMLNNSFPFFLYLCIHSKSYKLHYTVVDSLRSSWREFQALHDLGLNVPLMGEILGKSFFLWCYVVQMNKQM